MSSKGKRPNSGGAASHKGGKGKSADASSGPAHTVDADYMDTLQAQVEAEKKQAAAAAAGSQKKKKKQPKVVAHGADDDTGAGADFDDDAEGAVEPKDLARALKAAQSDAQDVDMIDVPASASKKKKSKSDKKKDAHSKDEDATNGKEDSHAAAAAHGKGGKTRLVRRADETAEEYKLRLKAEMKRRKHERKKAATKAAMEATQAAAAERKAQRQREHQERAAREHAAKLEKLQRAKEFEGLTNKEKRAALKKLAEEKAAADAASGAAETTSAESSSDASTPAPSSKKAKKAAAAAGQAAAGTSSAATPAPSSGVVSLSRPKSTAQIPLPSHSEWDQFNLHPSLLRALLLDLKFNTPTPIQSAVLTPAIRDWKDISAAATTGSGKTLAFGIPIVHRLMTVQGAPGWEDPKKIQALVLTPTRELAMQIVQHLTAIAAHATPSIGVTALVGGISLDKQKRVLDKQHPAIVVATPGRLWELMKSGETQHLSSMFHLRFLVLDEADRMVSSGHYAELDDILTFIRRNSDAESLTRKTRKMVEQFDGFEMLEDGDDAKGKVIREGEEQSEEEDAEDEKDAEAEGEAAEEAEGDEEDVELDATAAAESALAAIKGKDKRARFGKKGKAANDDIDWSSFLSEEEIFRQQGRRMPKEAGNAIERADEESGEEEEGEDGEQAEDAEDEEAEEDAEEDEEMPEEQDEDEEDEGEDAAVDTTALVSSAAKRPPRRQVFLFSATLMLSTSGREDASKAKHGVNSKNRREPQTVLDKLAERISFQSAQGGPHIVDLSSTHQVASTLTEVRADALAEEKDYLTYYFLLLYPGKTLVFVNSISCLRRLVSLLQVLKMPALPLHAEMQQKARLKSLERFKERDNSILICTDVAARGLDIPAVPYIIHYQLARTAEVYIHRSGRVARAGREGVAFTLIGPEEQKQYRRLCLVLKKVEGIPALPIDAGYMAQIRARMNLARDVETAQHKLRKSNVEREWFRTQAEAMEMELDEDEMQLKRYDDEDGAKDDGNSEANSAARRDAQVKRLNLQRELEHLLKQPLMHGTLSRKFFTLNAARGFDLGAESSKIAKAGSAALGSAGNGAANQTFGTQERSLKGLPDVLRKARTAPALTTSAPPKAKQQQSNASSGKKQQPKQTNAASSAAAPSNGKTVTSLSAKRKAAPAAEEEAEEAAAPAPAAAAAKSTGDAPVAHKAKKAKK